MDTGIIINTTVNEGGVINSTFSPATVIESTVVGGGIGPIGPIGPTGPQGPPGATVNNYYNVKTYGAIGDGTADDTVAINAAITVAQEGNGGTVFFPPGTYKISGALTLYTGVSLLGCGSEASLISQTSTTSAGIYGMDIASCSFEGLLIEGPSSGSGVGINLAWSGAGNVPFLDLRDIWVRNFGSDGIAIETQIVSHFDRVISQGNGGYGFNFYHAGTSSAFTACWARGNAFAGYHFYESVYINLSGCASDNNGVGYLIENAQSIGLYACGAESQVVGSGQWDGTGVKVSNSSCIGIYNCWIANNVGIGIWMTNGSIAGEIFAAADNSPGVGATAFIQTDVSTNTTVSDIHNTTANSYSPGTVTQLNDGANGLHTRYAYIQGASGTMTITSDPTSGAGAYALSVDTTGVLSLFGSGGQVLNLQLLDGYLELDTLTASTAIALDSNQRIVSSSTTATELGYVHGVTSSIQTQLNATFSNPMTTLGDIIYENSTPAATRLAGNTTSTKKFLTQTGTGSVSAAPGWNTILAADVPTLNQSTTGNAATVTTNANLTGPITSSGNATSIASQTGTGTTFVMNTSPTLVTPVLGAATGTSLTLNGASATALVVGPNGTTNPTLSVVTNTASAANGLSITSSAAGSGVALTITSSASNDNLIVNALGTGTIKIGGVSTGNITIGNTKTLIVANGQSSSGSFQFSASLSVASAAGVMIAGTYNASSGVNPTVNINPTINQTSTAGYTALLINPTETATGSGAKLLLDLQVGSADKFNISDTGAITGVAAMTIDSTASGTIGLNTLSTTSGLVTLGNSTSLAGAKVNGNLQVTNASGTLTIESKSDGADYNIFSSNGNQTLAIFGSAGNTLNLSLLDGNLTVASGISSFVGGTNTSGGATKSAPTFVSGTAQQLNVNVDTMLYIDVTVASVLTIAIGPTATPAYTLQSSVLNALGLTSIRVPAGWYVALTGTMANLTITAITC